MKVKLNKSWHQCYCEDEPVCPYCGYKIEDAWEYSDGEQEIECDSCGRSMYMNAEPKIEYTTAPIGDVAMFWDEGAVAEDGLNEEDEKWANENATPCEVVEMSEED